MSLLLFPGIIKTNMDFAIQMKLQFKLTAIYTVQYYFSTIAYSIWQYR